MIPSSGPIIHGSPDPVFELDHEDARMPYRSKERSVGLDIHPCESTFIAAGTTELVPSGLRCSFNYGWGAFFWDRSGMGFKGFHRFAGVIESDYVGFWGVVLYNSTPHGKWFHPDKAIIQVVFQQVWMGQPKQGTVNRDTDRGEAGFGSTDK
jgi:deoxyuridine 5'-triphosphate nucleotidohydrolase